MKHAPAAALLLWLAAAAAAGQAGPAGSQVPAATDTAVPAAGSVLPRDTRPSWTVGFTVLEAEGLSAENSYLAGAIPLLLRDRVARLPWHILSEEERVRTAAAAIDREQAALAAQAATLRAERDEALFTARPSVGVSVGQAAASARASAVKRLAEVQARAEALRGLEASAVEVAARKPLAVADGAGPAKLFDPPRVPPQDFLRAAGLDLLVTGSISEVQGFLRLELRAWQVGRVEPVFAWREAGSRDVLYPSLEQAGEGLVEPVLGMAWSLLRLRTQPVIAEVSVDGEVVSRAGPRELYLPPGPHELRVSAPGHAEEVRQLDLAARGSQDLAVELSALDAQTVTIATDPPGADLHLGALWLGRTPISLGLPVQRAHALLSMEGYRDLSFSLGPGAVVPPVFTLEPASGDRGSGQKAARDRFYRAFGWFLVSLPAPIFCYRYSYDYAAKAQDLIDAGDLAGAQAAVSAGTALYWGSIGGAALSVSLFGWVVSTIIRYIAVSDRAAG